MHPYYFGDSKRPLYGVYDPPRSARMLDQGVLLCYPLAQEYMRSHWAFRQLVSQLAKTGLHCMRFDFYGSGDSAGASVDGSMAQWHNDVETGLTELKDMAGISKVSLVGLRFGAAIAATAPVQAHKVKNLVLWDPVVNGAAYMDNLRRLHDSMLKHHKHYKNPWLKSVNGEPTEIFGFTFSERMLGDIQALDLLDRKEFSAEGVYLFVSEERPEYRALKAHLESLGVLEGYRVFPDGGDWEDPVAIDKALIASNIIKAIADRLGGK